jgi:hypothetical protein
MTGAAKKAATRKVESPISKTASDDPEESKRFIHMAREVEVDESKDALERAFKKVVHQSPYLPKPTAPRPRPSAKKASS